MSDVKKIATRESYGKALAELGAEHKDIVVLDADLAEATKTGVFKKAFPERFIDCGIAESNMMGVYRREQYDGSGSRYCIDRTCSVCKFFRNVRSRTCV